MMRRVNLNQHKLGWEIGAALALKITVLYLLWLMFFSAPIEDELTATNVGFAIFGATNVESKSASNPKEE